MTEKLAPSHDIAIVILSCDKFGVTWQPCIDHFITAWPDCPYPIYLLNNYTPSNDARVKDLLVGEDINWSDTLKKGLLKIKNERVFFLYDDAFIKQIDLQEVEINFKSAVENNLESVAFRKRIFDQGRRFNNNLYKINPSAKYRTSLFLNLIKKDILLELLNAGENAWQFEKDGSERSRKFDFYSVYSKKVVQYHHGIIKGKWMPKVIRYLRKSGYQLENNTFGIHSKYRVFTMWVYTVIFYTVHTVTHRFK